MYGAMQRSVPVAFLQKFLRTFLRQGQYRRLLLQVALLLSVMSAIVSRRRKQRALKSIERLPLPPGPRGWPIIGILPSLTGGAPQQTLADMSKTYGPVISFRLGNHLMVVLNDYDSIKEAFAKSGDAFSDRPNLTMFTEIHRGGAGVVLNHYENRWKEHRRFALKVLKNLGVGRSSIENDICAEARYVAQEFDEQRGRPFRTADVTNLAVSNIIKQLVFGSRNDYRDPRFQKVTSQLLALFKQMGVGVANFFSWAKYVPGSGYRELVEIPRFLEDEWYRPHAREHIKTFNANNIRDFTDAFILEYYMREDSPHAFDEAAIVGAVGNMYGAGVDTTSVALDWVVLMVTKHPEVQLKMQREMDEVIGRHRMPAWSDRHQLHYVMAVLDEIMRWSAGGPFGVPHSPIEDTEFRGYFIPKESVVISNIHAVMHNPEIFPEPSVFRPERFLDSGGKYAKNQHMMQFGLGRRGCIGEQLARMEVFIFATHILHQFTLVPPDGNPDSLSTGSFLGLSKNPLPYKLRAIRRTDTYDTDIPMDLLSDDNNNNSLPPDDKNNNEMKFL